MTGYQIPEPCHESWDAMTPADRGRHCASCDKVVVDLTACSGSEARAVLERAVPRADGSTGVCARVRVDARRRLVLGRFRRHVLTNGLALLLASGAMLGCEAPVLDGAQPVVAGEVTVVDPAPAVEPPDVLGDVMIMGEMVAPAPAPAVDECPPPVVMGRVAVPVAPRPLAQPEPIMGQLSVQPVPPQPPVDPSVDPSGR